MITVLHLSHIINSYDFIDVVIRHADRSRFRMLAATFTDDGSVKPGSVEYPVTNLGVRCRADFPRAAIHLWRFLNTERVDVLHAHHFDPTLVGVLATSYGHRPRLVIGRHYSDALYQLTPWWKRRAYLAVEGVCNRAAARIVAPSSMVWRILVERQGVLPEKVVQIPYGFDFAKHCLSRLDAPSRLRQELGLDGKVVIGTFSRLNADKGHTYLFRAFARLQARWPELRLLLVGEGNIRQELEDEVRARGLTNSVLFTGWRRDVMDLMGMVDIVVQPSLHEAFSQVMVEALALQKPLIFSDASGVRDVVRHRWNGMIVPQKDHEALAAAIAELLERPEAARLMGERGCEFVRRELGIRALVGRYETTYLEAIGQGAAAVPRTVFV